ncbi:MAG: hypothetical protein P4M00_25445 [Azospirillaceae bacterium]|nr:hypothetical protein [Azospirillaceae bacterium]
MTTPPAQKDRPISFYLTGGGASPSLVDLVIRPEELARTEPSRLHIQETLGGAWADSFDRGVAGITLSGTTGWRGGSAGSGEDQFAKLRETVFQGWHDRRAAAIANGIDPEDVELFFIDSLDAITARVAPRQFVLQRNRMVPLLMKFHIVLAVLDDAGTTASVADPVTSAFSNPVRWLTAVTNLVVVDGLLAARAANATALSLWFGTQASLAGSMIACARPVLALVRTLASDNNGRFDGAAAPVLSVARSLCQAFSGLFWILASATALASAKAAIMNLAGLIADAGCTLANGFNLLQSYPNFDALFGASNCSSTGGGRAASDYTTNGENPFLAMYPVTTNLIRVSAAARAGVVALTGDPMVLSRDPALACTYAGQIVAGITVSA